ncbi:hypothetical protein [Desulfosarcina sp.]|uniref:hypothetical protein n=1 Tax=Desulfosarcina sp. TaxID=2027861 RepID=UPI00356AB170
MTSRNRPLTTVENGCIAQKSLCPNTSSVTASAPVDWSICRTASEWATHDR